MVHWPSWPASCDRACLGPSVTTSRASAPAPFPSGEPESVAEMLLHLGRDDASCGRVGERRRDRGAIGVQALLAQLADDARQAAIVIRRLEGSRVHLLLQLFQLLDEALNRDRCHPSSSLW